MMIYVASSWRNEQQPEVVQFLRKAGYDVYDFRNPGEGNNGFHWSEIDPDWKKWVVQDFKSGLEAKQAKEGFKMDMTALRLCDACVLVLPCGRSAHLELGWAVGSCRATIVYNPPEVQVEPELMYMMCDLITDDKGQMLNFLDKRLGGMTFLRQRGFRRDS